jgi:hypothetical protein
MKSEPPFLTFGGIGIAISCQPLFVIHLTIRNLDLFHETDG